MKKILIFEIFWIFLKRNLFFDKKFQKIVFSFKVLELFIYLIFFHGTEVWGKVLLKVLFFEKKITKFQTWKKTFFSIFSKGFTAEKNMNVFLIFLKKILWETFFFINRHVKHTFVHSEYVEVPLGLAEHISGQDLMHRPLPTDIIWLEFGSFSNFLRKKFGFIQKMADLADLANLAGRCGRFHMNCLEILFWKKFKISRNLKNSLR